VMYNTKGKWLKS